MRGRLRAILNASPIIAFFEELRSHRTLLLLKHLKYELYVPQAVRDDIVKEPSAHLLSQCISDGDIVVLPSQGRDIAREFQLAHPALGTGELEVILHALDLRTETEVVCILDDRPARRVARSLDLSIIGTVGILKLLRDSRLTSRAEDSVLRKRLRSSSFRVGGDML